MTSICERCTDFAQAQALAGLGACPVKPLGQRYRAWPLLGMALAPFALSRLTALAVTCAFELGDK
ncbi:MAG: hypothetical protein V3R17_08405 [Hyphomicrobium sp.]